MLLDGAVGSIQLDARGGKCKDKECYVSWQQGGMAWKGRQETQREDQPDHTGRGGRWRGGVQPTISWSRSRGGGVREWCVMSVKIAEGCMKRSGRTGGGVRI